MSLKSTLIRFAAKKMRQSISKMANNATADQNKIFKSLIKTGAQCTFGKTHKFNEIKTHQQYIKNVPIRDYEQMRPDIEKIISGDSNVLWPGRPKYFAKTSGTTSGIKYIPISNESITYHISTARNAILNYIDQTGNNVFLKKMIFLSGSPELESKAGIKTGRLSGIVYHEIPAWVKPNQIPDYDTNCIEDWETKLDRIVDITLKSDMSLISGIPPWVQMYYERLLEKSGKHTIKELFPDFKLFIHGGVNYLPYKSGIEKLTGPGVDTLETYPASEGFIAFQNDINDHGLLLNTNAGMFFEFVPVDEIFLDEPKRLTLSDVKLDTDYALIITSNAGLWAYNIGDTIRFTHLDPYKIIVSGRIKHFISAFGEHVIAKEVEEAMDFVANKFDLKVIEFTVAPQVNPPEGGLPYHEWLIEFDSEPESIDIIAHHLDEEIIRQNIYYRDLIEGRILQTLKIKALPHNSFRKYMKSKGKLGGQNKVPRLTNDRDIADSILNQ
jgi:hypothetical protein